ncbi:hypothetical protein GCM10022384_31480 [Streptomyces marokkonensis]|uniref:Transposase n=1 Tax=Streptomyces marokkonensis TaxID=324855 RepID=A0ABP7QBF6_9ACTN
MDQGQVESLWVAERLGRPVVKAWNAALAGTLRTKGHPAGSPGRIALPVAADSDEQRRVERRPSGGVNTSPAAVSRPG